jgi:sarcosine oxidase subunit beta
MNRQVADIAIIGGGVVGLGTAYELARQGVRRIAVFEKANLASGTSGGSAGVVCLHNLGEIYVYLTLMGYRRIQYFHREHGLRFEAWGSLSVIYDPAPFPPASDPYWKFDRGEDSIYAHQLLDRSSLLARYPWLDNERVRGGIFYPNQGFIDPYELVGLYERLLTESGYVSIYRNTPVLEIRTDHDRITQLVTRRGSWIVGQVINAGGPWGRKIAQLAGSDVPLTPQRIQVCVATAFDDGVTEAPLFSIPEQVDGEGVWCRGEWGGTLLFGQHHNATRSDWPAVDPDFVNRINDPGYPSSVESVYRQYIRVPRSKFLNGWTCVYGTTADGFPIISRDQRLTNFYHALGMNGHGITIHGGVASCVAELILRGTTTIDVSDIVGEPATLDFSVLDVGRFERRALLTFELPQVLHQTTIRKCPAH